MQVKVWRNECIGSVAGTFDDCSAGSELQCRKPMQGYGSSCHGWEDSQAYKSGIYMIVCFWSPFFNLMTQFGLKIMQQTQCENVIPAISHKKTMEQRSQPLEDSS
mmetsp:Transcript_28372/g.70895  ORF Transcript_28372/g.70895 Transcript_28372/m.70895 type:complete len:105 (-) Transcript_28372:945-1259(-)